MNAYTEAINALESFPAELLKGSTQTHDLITEQTGKTYLRFAPKEWGDYPPLKQGKGWTKSGPILLLEFRNANDALTIWLEVGPGPREIRGRIHHYAIQNPGIFTRANKNVHSKWTFIEKRSVLKPNDDETMDALPLQERISRFGDQFPETDFLRIRIA